MAIHVHPRVLGNVLREVLARRAECLTVRPTRWLIDTSSLECVGALYVG